MPRAPTHSDDEIRDTIDRLVEGQPDRRKALQQLTRNAVVDALGVHPESGRRSSPDRVGPFLELARAAAAEGGGTDPTTAETQAPSSEDDEPAAAIVAQAQAAVAPIFGEIVRAIRHDMSATIDIERRRGRDLLEIEAGRYQRELTAARDELAQRSSEVEELRRVKDLVMEQVEEVGAERDRLTRALNDAETARDAAFGGKETAEARAAEAQMARERTEGELALAAERRLTAERARDVAEKRAVAAEASLERAVAETAARLADAEALRRFLESEREQLRQELRYAREQLDETRAATTAARVEEVRGATVFGTDGPAGPWGPRYWKNAAGSGRATLEPAHRSPARRGAGCTTASPGRLTLGEEHRPALPSPRRPPARWLISRRRRHCRT